jgi:hypothetical protein
MRMMLQTHVDAISGTEVLKSGRFQKALEAFGEKFKPEATYFLNSKGMRSCFFVFDMQGSEQMPEATEPFFELGCEVMLGPCMTPGDLQAGLAASGL